MTIHLTAEQILFIHYRLLSETGGTNILQFLHIGPVNQITLEQALNLDYPDFEDAVQMMSAVQCKADYLITRNIKGYDPAHLTVVQPISVLATF